MRADTWSIETPSSAEAEKVSSSGSSMTNDDEDDDEDEVEEEEEEDDVAGMASRCVEGMELWGSSLASLAREVAREVALRRPMRDSDLDHDALVKKPVSIDDGDARQMGEHAPASSSQGERGEASREAGMTMGEGRKGIQRRG